MPDTLDDVIDELLQMDDDSISGDIDEMPDATMDKLLGKEDADLMRAQRDGDVVVVPAEDLTPEEVSASRAAGYGPTPPAPAGEEPASTPPAEPQIPTTTDAATGVATPGPTPPAPTPGAAEDQDPEWLTKLPAEQRVYVEDLRSQNQGQRVALAKRGQRLRELESDRELAIRMALSERHRSAGAAPAQAAGIREPAVPGAEPGGRALDAGAAPAGTAPPAPPQRAPAQPAGPDARMQAYVNELVSDVPLQIQNHLVGAVNHAATALNTAVALEGVVPRSVPEQIDMLRRNGYEPELRKAYPGLSIEDIMDLTRGVGDPVNNGDLMIRVAQKAKSLWTQAAPVQGAPTPPSAGATPPQPLRPTVSPIPIPDHPSSMAGKGGPDQTGTPTLDRVVNMTMDEVSNMGDDEREALWRRWEEEFGVPVSGPPV